MNLIGYLLIFVGLIILLTGYWFLGQSIGQEQCVCNTELIATSNMNKIGGSIGIAVGIIIMLLGVIFGSSSTPVENTF